MNTSADPARSRLQPMATVWRCRSVAETEALGEALARRAQSGEVFGLSGDLGAGKTAWVRGFARGLDFKGRVHSPTFALLNLYEGGRCPIYHLDLYRLGSPAEVQSAGLEEILTRPDGIAVVEWIERWFGTDPTPPRGVRLHRLQFTTVSEEEREIRHEPAGL